VATARGPDFIMRPRYCYWVRLSLSKSNDDIPGHFLVSMLIALLWQCDVVVTGLLSIVAIDV
jgi:hypothetical protein